MDDHNRRVEELLVANKSYQQVTGKRPAIIEMDATPVPKKPRVPDHLRDVLAAKDDDNLDADPITIACPLKTVQFANHMIVGLQIDLTEIEELPKKFLQEKVGRAFSLQAPISLILPFFFHLESYICLLIYYFCKHLWTCGFA